MQLLIQVLKSTVISFTASMGDYIPVLYMNAIAYHCHKLNAGLANRCYKSSQLLQNTEG